MSRMRLFCASAYRELPAIGPTAAHLVDHVIPPVPVRQWVMSVPKRRRSRERLRGMLADRPAAVTALTKIFLDEIKRLLSAATGVASDAAAAADMLAWEHSGFSVDAFRPDHAR